MGQPQVLRPMGCLELFNAAFDLYKRSFVRLAGLGAVVYIPYILFVPCVLAFDLFKTVPFFAGLVSLIFLVALAVANGVLIEALAVAHLGREASGSQLWGRMRRRLVPFLLTSALDGLVSLVGHLTWI